MRTLYCTAATLRAMLCFVESGKTKTIAYDRDDLAEPLAKKLKEAVGDRAGSQPVSIHFFTEEADLERQFNGCAKNISSIFSDASMDFKG